MKDDYIPSFRITRRGIQLALGFIWLFDGVLQLQHQMFTSAFATQVIAPATVGQPQFVVGIMHFWIRLFLAHPVASNTLIAIIQLGIGALLISRRTVRLGLLFSIIWGLFVWYVGEGMGGVLSGQTCLLMGAPGAALLYVILSLAVIPPDEDEKPKEEHQYPAAWLAYIWAFLWVGGTVYQLLPGQNSTSSVAAMIANNASGAPGWLASLDMHVANAIKGFAIASPQGNGYWFILLLAILQLVIGFGVFAKKSTREFVLYFGMAVSVVFWVIGQSLGQYWTGTSTDPNTAPLFILLALAILGQPTIERELAKSYKRLEKFFI
jgi:hypothetical protein